MKLTSPAFENEGKIPSKHTCDGKNTSPPLSISGVPSGAKSLVLIMDDPDVPKNIREDGMWDHWIVFDIPPDHTEIREGREPKGKHGLGTGKNTSYFGPCPPDAEHRYYFKLYALDCALALPEKCTKQEVEEAMTGHVLDTAVLMGRYERS
jgi:Raf kinase inhibitor-like YbhB/YbcL family protein